jgi:maltose alpha-D-glucosyltransferase / alpha-amylase
MEPIAATIPGSDLFAAPSGLRVLETEILPRYLPACRWFGGKARELRGLRIEELIPISASADAGRLACIRVAYAEGAAETYLLPLRLVASGEMPPEEESAVIARFTDGAILFDAIHDAVFRSELLRLIRTGERGAGEASSVVAGVRGRASEGAAADLPSRVLKVEQSNSSIIFGDRVFLKLYRKLEDGINPDVEITRFLTEEQGFVHIAPFAGAIEILRPGREPQVLALALGLVPNEGDAWAFALGEVACYYDRVRTSGADPADFSAPPLLEPTQRSGLSDFIGDFGLRARQLGMRTGEMHLALAANDSMPAFAPEAFTAVDQRALSEALRLSIDRLLPELEISASRADSAQRELLTRLIAAGPELRRRAEGIAAHPVEAWKTRTHGDYHLGQVLNTGADFAIIDFEGEPLRPLAERRRKQSPLRDVAGMLRSFHYAAYSGLAELATDERAQFAPWAELWSQVVSRRFVHGWLEVAGGAKFVPAGREGLSGLLEAFLLEKAVYEVFYELNNRPAWLGIPIRGILQVLERRTVN